MSELVKLEKVRISFPQLIEATIAKGYPLSEPKFSADFLIMPDNPGFAKFYTEVNNLLVEKYKDKAPQVKALIDADKGKRGYGKGEERIDKKTFVPYDGYPGHFYITAKNSYAPQLIMHNGQPATEAQYKAEARKIYGGCFVNAVVRPWLQTSDEAVRCDLIAVQFSHDGEAFGEGNVDASGMFSAVAPAPMKPATDNGFSTPSVPSFMK